MAVFALMMAVALLAGEPDEVVATAPATLVDLNATRLPSAPSTVGAAQSAVPHGLSTDQQIDRWVASRSTADKSWSDRASEAPDDRKMHGQVSVGVGTGGYRDYGAAVSLPLGENGRMDIRFRQVENGYGYVPLDFDDNDYGYLGHWPAAAAAEFGSRLSRSGGSLNHFPPIDPNRNRSD